MASILSEGRRDENISDNEGKNWAVNMQIAAGMCVEGGKRG